MPNKMLIDATHPEETRVVVVRGNRVEEFDFESANRKQLRGNIYLAKVTRVEPSLQAAFIEYGGNRHGFLAFSEIHPDYYQIPVADRLALIEDAERAHREAEEESENRSNRRRSRHRSARRRNHGERVQSAIVGESEDLAAPAEAHDAAGDANDQAQAEVHAESHSEEHVLHGDSARDAVAPEAVAHKDASQQAETAEQAAPAAAESEQTVDAVTREDSSDAPHAEDGHGVPLPPFASAPLTFAAASEAVAEGNDGESASHHEGEQQSAEQVSALAVSDESDAHDEHHDDHDHHDDDHHDDDEDEDDEDEDDENGDDSDDDEVESVGGDDALEEVTERSFRPRRQYKIQEVIKRRQVMLVQVVKEERGNKGAALTTYLSLAGRYAVLMPNTARGGGISRKITSAQDRSRLKEVVQDLDVPEGMGIILRTAGASRTKPEIKRDFEYLLRLWERVRDTTLNSQAPTLVYEEGSLIKRSLRDLYNKDIDDILVSGEAGYHEARDFMKMLMPSNVKAVKLYHDNQPLFSRMGVESQLDAMFSPTVQLKSGGYLVINQTEALVSIDVNSGRSTREHHIEDTALKTNLEAAEEVARQLRLRDLAGLIVIDFIDMDEKRNNRAVERKLSDCLRQDRARIQVGRISHFGLLEMSRQRIRASMLESSTEVCPHCGGSGRLRSVGSVALQLIRGLEEVLMKGATHNLVVRTRTDVALYVLNHKRGHLHDLESSFDVSISIAADEHISGQHSYAIDRGEQVHTLEAAKALLVARAAAPSIVADEVVEDEEIECDHEVESAEGEDAVAAESNGNGEGDSRRRRRRRRRRGRGGEAREDGAATEESETADLVAGSEGEESDEGAEGADELGSEAAADVDAEAEAGESGEHDDEERRPRRRGRRGGRRRRGDADASGEAPAAGLVGAIGDDLGPVTESEAADAVADLSGDGADTADSAASAEPAETAADSAEAEEHAAPAPEQPAPEAPAEAMPEAPDEEAKPARRRSTVREKVTFYSDNEAAPAAQAEQPAPVETPAAAAPAEQAPVAEEPAQDSSEEPAPAPAPEADKPRRAGWWSRRFGSGN